MTDESSRFLIFLHFSFYKKKILVIRDAHVELQLFGTEYKIMKTEEKGQNYPNLSKEERETLDNMMKDDSVIIKSENKKSSGIVIEVRKII